MRAAPAVTVELPRCGAWAVAVALLGLLAGAALGGLACGHRTCSTPAASIFTILAAAAGLALLLVALPAARGRLRWDGECWWFQSANGRQPERSGTVTVMLDLGGWMLLRFLPSSSEGLSQRASWLPVSDARLGPPAHALRAAVYSRRLNPDDNLPRRGPEPE